MKSLPTTSVEIYGVHYTRDHAFPSLLVDASGNRMTRSAIENERLRQRYMDEAAQRLASQTKLK